jgi:carboxypeptidase C (cathepsin A)
MSYRNEKNKILIFKNYKELKMNKLNYFVFLILLFFSSIITAQPKIEKVDSSESIIPKPVQVITHNSIKIDGKEINYTATTGTLLLKNESDSAIALIGFTYYTKDGISDYGNRPITFAYNGGPGSSSIWLHMGALGPKRVVLEDPNAVPPAPYKIEDNKYSILDVTDLVLIDPVGTGLSKAVGKAKGKDFWGVNEDIKSISEFIYQFLLQYNRLNSPKFLLGESYGTTRSAGVSDYLFENKGIAVNGIIFISTVFNFQTLSFNADNDLPYILFLPTYSAVSWYHNALPTKPADLKSFLKEVVNFAMNEYANALFRGSSIDSSEYNKIVEKLFEYTGLSKAYWRKANLRVNEPQFTAELLRQKGETIGRLDSRYKGPTDDLLREYSDFDPQSTAISSAFITTFLEYFHDELKFPTDQTYHIDAYSEKDFKWNWNMNESGRISSFQNTNVSQDLADVMRKDPYLNILMLNGYYDLATPFFATEFTINHLGNNIPNLEERVHIKYYEAGHMMYINNNVLPVFKKDISNFILKMSESKTIE